MTAHEPSCLALHFVCSTGDLGLEGRDGGSLEGVGKQLAPIVKTSVGGDRVVRCLGFVVCCLGFVVCCLGFVVCGLGFVMCCLGFVM